MRMILEDAGIPWEGVATDGGPRLMWYRALREVGQHGPDGLYRLHVRVRRDHPDAFPALRPPPVDEDPVLDAWRRAEWERLRFVRLLGYRQSGRIKLSLDQVFVSLHIRVGHRRPGEPMNVRYQPEWAQPGDDETFVPEDAYEPVDLAGALRQAHRRGLRGLALLGDPGAGKTTLLRHLFCRVVLEGSAAIGLPDGLCPVLLRCAKLTEEDRVEYGIAGWLRRELHAHPAVADRLAARSRPLLLLLDGLDEVPDEAFRERVCRWLDEELDRWTDCFFVVTCRSRPWTRARLDTGFLPAEIRWLNDGQLRTFVEQWYIAVEEGLTGDGEGARTRAEELIARLTDRRQQANYDLRQMARNPLLLSTLCLVHREGDRLPERRARLYEECVRVLLEKWAHETERPGLPVDKARRILQPLAWAMQTRGQDAAPDRAVAEFSREEVRAAVAGVYARVPGLSIDLDTFLTRAQEDCGLLSGPDNDTYAFLHLSLQEYLAARHARADEARLAELADRIGDPRWREVILLAMSLEGVFAPFMRRVVANGALAAHRALLDACFDEADEHDPEPFLPLLDPPPRPWWRRLLFGNPAPDPREVAAALTLFRRRPLPEIRRAAARWVDHPDPAVSAAARALVAPPPAPAVEAAPPDRLPAADALGFEWAWLPPGEFWMGATKKQGERNHDPDAFPDEGPVHPVTLRHGFYMAVHPVTNAQYAEFLADTNAREPAFWRDSRFNGPRQPVVGVDWNDARTFCRWLTARGDLPDGWIYDLPTEAEWEYAARGPAGRRFPWGDAPPAPERAVFGLSFDDGSTAPVGDRPAGATPEGVHDLAGNVWEWTLDAWRGRYGNPPSVVDSPCYQGSSSGDPRVVRGGSRDVGPERLRATFRGRSPPRRRAADVGFRVVRVRVREHVPLAS